MEVNKIELQFNKIWSSYFYKKNATLVENGRQAIVNSLLLLKSKNVALPTYTCHRVLQACLMAGTNPYLVDCTDDLQIDINAIPKNVDTVIVPHMFGIQADIKTIKNTYNVKVIEDCSQCIGLLNLGKYSDIVIASTGPTKWLNAGDNKEKGGAILAYNKDKEYDFYSFEIGSKLNEMFFEIPNRLDSRKRKAEELINAGIDLIGKDKPNSYLRAMYYGRQTRTPYTPLHDIYPGFNCPNVDKFKNNLEWISIFP